MDGSPNLLRPVCVLTVMMSLFSLLTVTSSEGQMVPTSITNSNQSKLNAPENLGTRIIPGSPTTLIRGGSLSTGLDGKSNLFHSFGDFSIASGETALFQNLNGAGTAPLVSTPGSVSNIIGRVTGTKPSNIYGTISTQIDFPSASLFLINPQGIVVGPNAHFNVGGSIHLSTADYLRMKDGAQFFANLDKQSTLSSEPVTAFGFLGERPASPITVQAGNPIAVNEGKTISLIGGDISITGRTLSAPSGRINLVSVASGGEVVPNEVGQPASLTLNGFIRQGTLSLTDGAMIKTSSIHVDADAGPVFIRSGRFVMDNAGIEAVSILPHTDAPSFDPSDLPSGGKVNIRSEVIDMKGGALATDTQSGVTIRTNNQGDITLATSQLSMDHAKIITDGQLPEPGQLDSPASNISDETGYIHIQGLQGEASLARQVSLTNGSVLATKGLLTEFIGGVRARDVSVEATDIYLAGSTISTDQGVVKLHGANQILSGGNNVISKTAAGTSLTALAGIVTDIELTSEGTIALSAGDKISTQITGRLKGGAAGSIGLTAPHIIMKGTSDHQILIEANGFGDPGGTVTGGNINLTSSSDITMVNSKIKTSAVDALGGLTLVNVSGGNIDITAPNMVRLVASELSGNVTGNDRGSRSSGGNVSISNPQYVILQGNSVVNANATGAGGKIVIQASRVFMQEPGTILTATGGSPELDGLIAIQAPIQQLSGAIAPMPQAFAVATNLYGQRCATQKGGQFSSFVQGARDGVPPQPGDLIPSPLLLQLDEASSGTISLSSPNLAAIRLGLPGFGLTPHRSLTVFAGCQS